MNYKKENNIKINYRSGFTLIEIIIAIIINMIVILGVGTLLVGGNRAWHKCYNTANHQIKQDALATTLEFGNIGRKSNRLSYTIYKKVGNKYFPAEPITGNPEEIVSGEAVEFRYWSYGLDSPGSNDLMDTSKIATSYGFFYVEGTTLKVDYGPYPPGAISGNGYKNAGVESKILAENVIEENSDAGYFSHTTINGVGQGSVRINVTLKNADDNESVQIMTATFLRNIWPR